MNTPRLTSRSTVRAGGGRDGFRPADAFDGLNPAMGWSLAMASGLTERRDAAVLATMASLAMVVLQVFVRGCSIWAPPAS